MDRSHTPQPETSAEPARQRLAGVALMLAVALGLGATPGALGFAMFQMACCGGVERVWLDLTRDGTVDRAGSTATAGARNLQGALAKAVRDLLKGTTRDVAADRAARVEFAALSLDPRHAISSDAIVGRASRGLDRALYAQPPPIG